MALEILKPGLSTTVQDLGRLGSAVSWHSGIGRHGQLIPCRGEPAGRQPRRRGGARGGIFRAGSVLTATLSWLCAARTCPKSRRRRAAWLDFVHSEVRPDASFGFLKSGARAYIAIAGGIDVPLVLGSRSTYPLGALGGFEGRALKVGDRVNVGTQSRDAQPGRSVPPKLRIENSGATELRAAPRPLLASADGRGRQDLFRGCLEGCAGGRSNRISLPRRSRPLVRAEEAAVRRRL